jgi:diguanylate cyclase (GGDEF)-like protein
MLRYWKTGLACVLGSIRGRILLLLLVTVVPLVGERVRGLELGRQDRLKAATNQLLDITADGAQRQRQMLSSTGALLQTIAAAVPDIGDLGNGQCQTLFNEIKNPAPWIHALAVVPPSGRIACSTRADLIGLDIASRDYFIEAIQTASPVVSDFLVGRATATPIVIVTLPQLAPNGRVKSILFAALRLDWMEALIADRSARSDLAVFIVDGSGKVIARSPDPENLKSTRLPQHALVQAILSGTRTLTAEGLDGQRRVFAAAQLNDYNAHLVVGLSEQEILANINRQVYIAYGILGFVVLAVMLAAWLGSDRLIVRPIRALASMAGALGRGDFEAGRGLQSAPTEFEPLVAAIRSMAGQLRARESAMLQTNEHLGRLAQFDALTGLCNRRSFDARLAARFAKARLTREPVALLMVDVDHFKEFNDNYGHVAGDACLQEVAKAIASVVRDTDFAARYGGEEFAVLAYGLDAEGAVQVAERLRRAVRAAGVPHEGSPHRLVTVSVGIASTIPAEGEIPERLVEEADIALYSAKKQGRDRIATGDDTLALAS